MLTLWGGVPYLLWQHSMVSSLLVYVYPVSESIFVSPVVLRSSLLSVEPNRLLHAYTYSEIIESFNL